MRYNKITKELKLFGLEFNFEKPTIFRTIKGSVIFKRVRYCYVFPQKVYTWHNGVIIETMYYFLWWRILFLNYQKQKEAL